MNLLLTLLMLFACLDVNEPPKSQDGAKSSSTSSKQLPGTKSSDIPFTAGPTKATARVKGKLLERHKQLGKDAGDAIALWIEAAIRAQKNEPEGWEALGYLSLPYKGNKDWQKLPAANYLLRQLKNPKKPCFKSFVVGATPENGYEVDLDNIRINMVRAAGKDGSGHKFFIQSSGSELPRPIRVKRSKQTGLFYISEFSSMYVDVRPAVDPNKETFE